MRFRAESTALHSQSDQAVSVRRPLRRRFDTIARPARVRIRSRKPCTRARRRLFGWKVRLPFATTISSLHLASRSDLVCHVGRTRLPSRSLSRLGVSLVTGAGPGHIARIAAVSPTFGRLFEGTDDRSSGQTFPIAPSTRHRNLTAVTPATAGGERCYESTRQCCRTVGAQTENLLASCMPFRTGTAPDNEARMADRLPFQATYAGCLERRSCVLSPLNCGVTWAVLSTPVDNHVDSPSSHLMVVYRRRIRGIRR